MLLKKPYVLLIKHFKLFHLILSLLTGYSILKINKLLSFFNNYISVQNSVVGQNLREKLYSTLMIIIPLIILLISISMLILMVRKKKPFRFYLYNTLVYIFIFGVIIYTFTYLGRMEVSIIDNVGVRALRDILIICLILQSISLLVSFIRATGFDIKSFEFKSDLQQLEISEEDQEEYELEFSFDSNESKRKRRKSLRYLKYEYQENRFIINLFIFIMCAVIGFFIYSKVINNFKTYKEEQNISTFYYDFSVEKTYVTNVGYNGAKLTDDYLVVVLLNIKANSFEKKLMTGNFVLQIGNNVYANNKEYNKYLFDIGNAYESQNLSNEYQKYYITFKISKEDNNKSMQLVYTDENGKYKIKLKPQNDSFSEQKYNLGEKIQIDDLATIQIDNYELRDMFEIKYDYCLKDNCYNSIQYLVPTLDTNYDKTIIKIQASLETNKNNTYTNLNQIIASIGYINYKIDGVTKSSSLSAVQNIKKNENNIYYYEVNNELLNAEEIYLVFGTRKCKYYYIFK